MIRTVTLKAIRNMALMGALAYAAIMLGVVLTDPINDNPPPTPRVEASVPEGAADLLADPACWGEGKPMSAAHEGHLPTRVIVQGAGEPRVSDNPATVSAAFDAAVGQGAGSLSFKVYGFCL